MVQRARSEGFKVRAEKKGQSCVHRRANTVHRKNMIAVRGIPILANLYGLVIIGLLAVDQARGYQIFFLGYASSTGTNFLTTGGKLGDWILTGNT